MFAHAKAECRSCVSVPKGLSPRDDLPPLLSTTGAVHAGYGMLCYAMIGSYRKALAVVVSITQQDAVNANINRSTGRSIMLKIFDLTGPSSSSSVWRRKQRRSSMVDYVVSGLLAMASILAVPVPLVSLSCQEEDRRRCVV